MFNHVFANKKNPIINQNVILEQHLYCCYTSESFLKAEFPDLTVGYD